jgi:hypothetical protein
MASIAHRQAGWMCRAWEDGTEPLASAPISQLDNLIDRLRAAGADPDLVADIDAAAWSDVVLAAMAGKEDTSCLLADPLACTRNFAELLDWASTGNIPARYSPYASSATFTGGVPQCRLDKRVRGSGLGSC